MTTLTCDQARLHFSDLLAGALSAADAADLDDHLTHCTACRAHASTSCRLHRGLCELTAKAHQPKLEANIQNLLRAEPSAAPVRRQSWQWLSAAAAVLLAAIGVGYWLTPPAPAAPIARLERIEGEVFITTGGARQLVAGSLELRSGQGVQTVGETSEAVVIFTDGTRLELGPDSTLGELSQSPDGMDKRVSLLSGYLEADVTKQAAGRPMILNTPHAEVVVHGTKFSLVNSPDATRVELEKGAVRFTRRSDGQSVEMAPGTFSIARTQTEPLGPQPLPAQYAQPRANLPATVDRLWALAFAPDGRTLVTGASKGLVRLWDPARGADQVPVTLCDDLQQDVRALAFSRDGRYLAAGSDYPPTVRVWDWNERQVIASRRGHRTWIEALAFSKDARTLVVAGAHGPESPQIHRWDFRAGISHPHLDGHAQGVWCVAVSPDGKTLASTGRDGVIKLWDFERGELRGQLLGHTSEVYALAFSPDGGKLVSSSRDKTVKLWDVAAGRQLHSLLGHSKEIRAVAFAPDGRTIASGSQDATVRLWRVADGLELATFKLPGSAFAVAFSPDGRTLAAGGWYKTVQLFDLPAEPAP